MVNRGTTGQLLKRLKKHNGWGYAHSLRVGNCAGKAGVYLGLGEMAVQELVTAALLHDIGKLLVPSGILDKPGPLTGTEYRAVKRHTEYGYWIVKLLGYPDAVCEAVRNHHERYDGKGYRKQKETSLFARIISVADAWDAMGYSRPYREGMGEKTIYQAMKEEAGTQFDPAVWGAMVPVLFPDRKTGSCGKGDSSPDTLRTARKGGHL